MNTYIENDLRISFPNQSWRNFLQEKIEIPLLVKLLSLPRGGRILEIGCGRGIALPVLSKLCDPSLLVGLDIDIQLLKEARQHLQARKIFAKLQQGDIRALPFEDESFDLIIDFGTCYHLRHPEKALSEIERVLSPNGIFVHETRLSQFFAHPLNFLRRSFPQNLSSFFQPHASALFWAKEKKKNA